MLANRPDTNLMSGWLDKKCFAQPLTADDAEQLAYHRQVFENTRDPFFQGIPQGPSDKETYYGVGPGIQAMMNVTPSPEPCPAAAQPKQKHSKRSEKPKRTSRRKRQTPSTTAPCPAAAAPSCPAAAAPSCPAAAAPSCPAAATPPVDKGPLWTVDEHGVYISQPRLPPNWVPPPEYFLPMSEIMKRKKALDPNYDPGWRSEKRFWWPHEFDMRWYGPPPEMIFNDEVYPAGGPDPMDTSPIPAVEKRDMKRNDWTWLDEKQNRLPFDMDDKEQLERNRQRYKELRDPDFKGIPQGPPGSGQYYGQGPATEAIEAFNQGRYQGNVDHLIEQLEGKRSWWPEDNPQPEPAPQPCLPVIQEERESQRPSPSTCTPSPSTCTPSPSTCTPSSPTCTPSPPKCTPSPPKCTPSPPKCTPRQRQQSPPATVRWPPVNSPDGKGPLWSVDENGIYTSYPRLPAGWIPPPEFYLPMSEIMERKKALDPNYDPGLRSRKRFWWPNEFDMRWYGPPPEMEFTDEVDPNPGVDPMDTSPIPAVEKRDMKPNDWTWLDEKQNRLPFDMDDVEQLERNRQRFKELRDPDFKGIPQGPPGSGQFYGRGPATEAIEAYNEGRYQGNIDHLIEQLEGKRSWWPDEAPPPEPEPESRPCPCPKDDQRRRRTSKKK